MPRARLVGRLAALAALVVGASTLTACAGAQTAPPLPDGLAVAVRQGRLDAADGILVVGFENTGAAPVTIDGFEVRVPNLEPGMAYDEPFELGADDRLDLRLRLTPAVCDAPDTDVVATVLVRATTPAGPSEGELAAADPFDTLARLADTDCVAESAAAAADIRMPDALRSEGAGTARRAYLDVLVEPAASGDASLRIGTVYGTTLINAEGGTDWVVDREVQAGDEPFTITLAVKPARCDAHAIADDKRGTILPFGITTGDGREGRLDRAAGDALKAEVYGYYTERCGL